MPLPNIPVPSYPNVPNVPGVPAVARLASASLPLPLKAMFDAADRLGFVFAPAWGIFDASAGVPVLIGDAVAAVEYQNDKRISDYPVEQGGFASYNKVTLPFAARVTFMVGGSDARRAAFLATVDAMAGALTLYSVVTPEITYPQVNVTHYDYRREQRQGATLLRVDVWVQEIRTTATTRFTETKAASGAESVNGGTVQAQPFTQSGGRIQ